MQETLDALEEIRTLATDFALGRLRPNVERWDHDRAIDRAALHDLAETGFHGMLVPETHGGLGLGLPAFVTAVEALAWGEPAVAMHVLASAAATTALVAAPDGEHRGSIEAIVGGAAVAWSLAPHNLIAVRDDAQWRLDGNTPYLLRTGQDGTTVVRATVGADTSHGWFALPAQSALPAGTRETTLGLRSLHLERTTFDGVRVADATCIARGTTADDITKRVAIVEHLGMAAIAAGIARAALEYATRYAAEREQFRQRLREFEGIQAKLADMTVRCDAALALLQRAAQAPDTRSVAGAKLVASETAMWVSTQAVQIFGGYGYMRDYPVEKLMRDAKATEILTRSNEDLRVAIAAALYDV